MTGDRSGLSAETLRNLRHSNLAHLLAISGLHMGLLVALVFAALRLGLSLIPSLASGSAVKKIAALGAVILERRAINLRAVALTAMVILIQRPDATTRSRF